MSTYLLVAILSIYIVYGGLSVTALGFVIFGDNYLNQGVLWIPIVTNTLHIGALIGGMLLKHLGITSLKRYEPYPIRTLQWLYLLVDFWMASCVGAAMVGLILAEDHKHLYTIAIVSNLSVLCGTGLCVYKSVHLLRRGADDADSIQDVRQPPYAL